MVWSHPQNGLQNLRPLDRVGAMPDHACIGDVYLITLYIYTYRYNTILNNWMIVVSGYESWRPSDSVKNSICRGEWSLVVKIV